MLQSSASVSRWLTWIIRGRSASYKFVQRLSSVWLQRQTTTNLERKAWAQALWQHASQSHGVPSQCINIHLLHLILSHLLCYLLYFNVGISKYFNLSEYDKLLQADTILVALFCTFSNISMRPTPYIYGDHIEFKNSKYNCYTIKQNFQESNMLVSAAGSTEVQSWENQ